MRKAQHTMAETGAWPPRCICGGHMIRRPDADAWRCLERAVVATRAWADRNRPLLARQKREYNRNTEKGRANVKLQNERRVRVGMYYVGRVRSPEHAVIINQHARDEMKTRDKERKAE